MSSYFLRLSRFTRPVLGVALGFAIIVNLALPSLGFRPPQFLTKSNEKHDYESLEDNVISDPKYALFQTGFKRYLSQYNLNNSFNVFSVTVSQKTLPQGLIQMSLDGKRPIIIPHIFVKKIEFDIKVGNRTGLKTKKLVQSLLYTI